MSLRVHHAIQVNNEPAAIPQMLQDLLWLINSNWTRNVLWQEPLRSAYISIR